MDILKDVAALEQLFDKEINNYGNTTQLSGKKWYSLGLEDNESNNQKDDANKKGIIRKMIDVVINFINSIVKRIKEFFTGRKNKDNEKVFKEYDGPGDSAKARAFAEHTRAMDEMNERMDRKNKEHKERMEKMEKEGAEAQKEHDEYMAREAEEDKRYKFEREQAEKLRMKNAELADKIVKSDRERDIIKNSLNELSAKTGKVMTSAEIEEAIETTLVKKFFSDTNRSITAMFALTLNSDYEKHYKFAHAAHEKLSKAVNNDTIPDIADAVAISDSCNELKKLVQLHKNDGEKELWATMTKVLNGDTNLSHWSSQYINPDDDTSIYDVSKKAVDKLHSIKETATKEEVSMWRDIAMALSDFFIVAINLHKCSEHISNMLIRFK